MFTIRRRLLAVTALALLAIAQVIPASAGYTSVSHGSCPSYNAVGGSFQVPSQSYSYGYTFVSASCGYTGVHAFFYDPVAGEYYSNLGLRAGSGNYYDDNYWGVVTPVFSYHRYGPSMGNYSTNTSYG